MYLYNVLYVCTVVCMVCVFVCVSWRWCKTGEYTKICRRKPASGVRRMGSRLGDAALGWNASVGRTMDLNGRAGGGRILFKFLLGLVHVFHSHKPEPIPTHTDILIYATYIRLYTHLTSNILARSLALSSFLQDNGVHIRQPSISNHSPTLRPICTITTTDITSNLKSSRFTPHHNLTFLTSWYGSFYVNQTCYFQCEYH